MGALFADAELAAFVANFRATADDPHQDFGDVGHIFEEIEEHRVLEELAVARKLLVAARRHGEIGLRMTNDLREAIAAYEALLVVE